MHTVYEETSVVTDATLKVEDGGMALIQECEETAEILTTDRGFFVRLQSWDDDKVHPLMNELIGKRIRITVEVED